MVRPHRTHDVDLVLKAAGLIATSAAVATIVDLGAGLINHGEIVIDVTDLEIASNDEAYTIVPQFSPDSDFGTAANIQDGPGLHLGAKETKATDCDKDDVVGRYILPFRNEFYGTVFRYMRLYTVVAGTIATGINYSAYIGKR